MMTYTKGPWKWVDEYNEAAFNPEIMDSAMLVNEAGDEILYYAEFDTPTFVQWEKMKANARLIAAAPDLLEALEAIKNLLDGSGYAVCRKDGAGMGLGEQVIIGDVFEKIENAIAKTKGKTND